MNKTISDSSGVGYEAAEITGKAEREER